MKELNDIVNTLTRYAEGRKRDVERGLETPAISALIIEKYAVGMIDTVRTLGLTDIDINHIVNVADQLCLEICPEHVQLRELRYQRVADLDLSKNRQN